VTEVRDELLVGHVEVRRQDPEPLDDGTEACDVVFEDHGADHVLEVRDLGRREPLAQPEVQEGDAAAPVEDVVARVRVPVERLELVDAAEREAIEALGCELALVVGPADDLGERGTLHQLGGEHPGGGQLVEHRRHCDERMVPVELDEDALVIGLDPVVQLLDEPFPQLRDDGRRVQSGEQHPEHLEQQVGALQVRGDGLVDARVLDLHRDGRTIVGHGPMHLADRRRRQRHGIPFGEHGPGQPTELVADHLVDELGGHRRGVLLELGERLTDRLGQTLVEVAGHLAELHQGALHAPEHLGDLFGAAELELVGQLLSTVVVR